jgi:lysophospholipase L1-like esterase
MTQDKTQKNLWERNPKKVLFLLFFLFLLVATFLAEKFLEYKQRPNVYRLGATRYVKLRELGPGYADVLVPTDLGLELTEGLERKGYRVRVDDNGFLMPSKIHHHPEATVVFLGGSTTECLYMDEDQRLPYVAGRLLEAETGQKINSYNGAKSGNDSLHCLNLLINKVIPLHPEIVVFMENVNDLSTLLYEGSYWTNSTARSPIIDKQANFKTVGKNFQESFHLLRDLLIPNLARQFRKFTAAVGKTDEFQGVRGRKIRIDQDHLVREYRMNLQMIVNICKARKITPVLMTQENRLKDRPDPLIAKLTGLIERQQGISYREYKQIYDQFNDAVLAVGLENQITVIDLAGRVPQEKEYMVDMVHFNPRGARYAAGIIADTLAPLLRAARN